MDNFWIMWIFGMICYILGLWRGSKLKDGKS